MSEIETVQNLHPDPRCLRVRNMWRAMSTIVVEHLSALYQSGEIQFPWVAGPRDAQAGQIGPMGTVEGKREEGR